MAALASYLEARTQHGTWLLRMEDLDPPRESPEAASRILYDLDALGLHWDGPVLYQSQRHAAYDEAITRLTQQGHAYWCSCSRQVLAAHNGRYPGTCSRLQLPADTGRALRCRLPDEELCFTDQLQGRHCWHLQAELGDFVIRRRDGLHAYQLAVVVDDASQGITHVVRGIDLLDSTPRQIHLQRLLGLPTPHYTHIPVLVNADGQKLSKQSFAAAIPATQPVRVLFDALVRLQQQPDVKLLQADRDSVLAWALQHWRPERMAGMRAVAEIPAPPAPVV